VPGIVTHAPTMLGAFSYELNSLFLNGTLNILGKLIFTKRTPSVFATSNVAGLTPKHYECRIV
jgi:hypothetical protein